MTGLIERTPTTSDVTGLNAQPISDGGYQWPIQALSERPRAFRPSKDSSRYPGTMSGCLRNAGSGDARLCGYVARAHGA
jgi:hypothetical protein